MKMRLSTLALFSASIIGAAVPAMSATHTRHGAKSSKLLTKKPAKLKSQSGIDDARATELQIALIHAGYLVGEPSGHWDAQSGAAMTKLQADNGWQTKLVPDSRAIIKLGLGPSADSVSSNAGALPQSASGIASQR